MQAMIRSSNNIAAALIALALLIVPTIAAAAGDANDFASGSENDESEHISELTRRGEHFKAIAKLYGKESNPTLADQLAAAKSAWALGLVARARSLWDEVLANKDFQEDERYRATLARAIVELQEANFEEARGIAERAAGSLPESELRGQFWLVIAEALKEQKALGLAEDYYKRAIKDGDKAVQNEARYLLGECQLKLGMINQARYSYAAVEANSSYTLQSLRRLIEIDLSQRNYEGVLTWLGEGRETYPGEFKDGWSSYAMVTALTELGRDDDAKKELQDYRIRRSDQDSWFPLAEAAVEAHYMRAMLHEPRETNEEPSGNE